MKAKAKKRQEVAVQIRNAYLKYQSNHKYDNLTQANQMCTMTAVAALSAKGKTDAMNAEQIINVYELVQQGIVAAQSMKDIPSIQLFKSLQKTLADEIDASAHGLEKIIRI